MSLLKELNETYLKLHTAKEEAFWAQKMGHAAYVVGSFEEREGRLKEFVTDASKLPRLRDELAKSDLTADQRTALEGWRRFFETNVVENQDAKDLQMKLLQLEGELERARRGMKLGYTDPQTGTFVEAGSDKMRLIYATAREEATRRAAWEGMGSIEKFVLQAGYLDIVKERNRLGRLLGYEDYYDYKVNLFEGFSKKKLFELLGELERDTSEACAKSVESLAREHGASAREPWNFEFLISGDLTKLTEPYLPFESALARWAKSFAAMDITFRGATLNLDLVARKGKEENGFMHGPVPGYVESGTFLPARINFTANAIPSQVGGGYKALATLFHEGGHAAHFSNILMPAPCFSQEFAPTSVAFAETQSMFMDHLVEDPDWRVRYAKNERGESMPRELIREGLIREHRFMAYRLRSLLTVPYAERAIYEMPDSDLTPENVIQVVRDIERKMTSLNAGVRPTLSVPHLLSGEASAYYHGYVLAQMAVYHTRRYFLRKYGHIMDNPEVGKEISAKYWAPGNSKTFLELVKELTGEPFSAAATVEEVNRSAEDLVSDAEAAMDFEAKIPMYTGPIALDAKIRMVHGDEVIASTETDSFETVEKKFSAWIRAQK